jgi:hypothetical protein
VEGFPAPVRADAVPPELVGVRTIFDGLHHLPPGAARAMLADAAQRGVPFVAAEAVERSAFGLLRVLFSPVWAWAVTPLLRPVSAPRLVFTYLVPLVPLIALWDGVVSVLRCFLALVEGLAPRYAWSVEQPGRDPAGNGGAGSLSKIALPRGLPERTSAEAARPPGPGEQVPR